MNKLLEITNILDHTTNWRSQIRDDQMEWLVDRVEVLTEALKKFDMKCYTCGSDEIAQEALCESGSEPVEK